MRLASLDKDRKLIYLPNEHIQSKLYLSRPRVMHIRQTFDPMLDKESR